MIYNLTSSKEVIARVQFTYELDYSGWVNKAPLWIADALDDMQIYYDTQITKATLNVIDHKAKLPCNIRLLRAVVYNGARLEELGVINKHEPEDIESIEPQAKFHSSEETYELDKNGWMSLSFESGVIEVHYQSPPIEYDKETNIYFPLIPDIMEVKKALEFKIIESIMYGKHKVGDFTFNPNDVFRNPSILYNSWARRAKNKVGALDPNQRYQISKLIRSLLIDIDNYRYGEFIDTNKI